MNPSKTLINVLYCSQKVGDMDIADDFSQRMNTLSDNLVILPWSVFIAEVHQTFTFRLTFTCQSHYSHTRSGGFTVHVHNCHWHKCKNKFLTPVSFTVTLKPRGLTKLLLLDMDSSYWCCTAFIQWAIFHYETCGHLHNWNIHYFLWAVYIISYKLHAALYHYDNIKIHYNVSRNDKIISTLIPSKVQKITAPVVWNLVTIN